MERAESKKMTSWCLWRGEWGNNEWECQDQQEVLWISAVSIYWVPIIRCEVLWWKYKYITCRQQQFIFKWLGSGTLVLKGSQGWRCGWGDIHVEMKCGSLGLIIVSTGSYISDSDREASESWLISVKLGINEDSKEDFSNSQTMACWKLWFFLWVVLLASLSWWCWIHHLEFKCLNFPSYLRPKRIPHSGAKGAILKLETEERAILI